MLDPISVIDVGRKELEPLASIRARDGDSEVLEIAEQETEIAERLRRSRSGYEDHGVDPL